MKRKRGDGQGEANGDEIPKYLMPGLAGPGLASTGCANSQVDSVVTTIAPGSWACWASSYGTGTPRSNLWAPAPAVILCLAVCPSLVFFFFLSLSLSRPRSVVRTPAASPRRSLCIRTALH